MYAKIIAQMCIICLDSLFFVVMAIEFSCFVFDYYHHYSLIIMIINNIIIIIMLYIIIIYCYYFSDDEVWPYKNCLI